MRVLGGGAALVLAAALGAASVSHADAAEQPALLAEPYIATDDNTLHDIAVVFDLGYLEVLAANPGVDPWKPGDGTRVQLPTRHLVPDGTRKGLIVNIGDQRAYLFGQDGEVESFPIGIGREGWSIPLGQTRITSKRENPTWTPPKSIREENPDLPTVVPAGPENPLGNHALNLGFPAYLLHGTNKPDGVGRRVSHGCIRFYPWDIEYLFGQVKVGTPVQVVHQPVKFEMIEGELYLEVHPEGQQLDQLEETGQFTSQPIPEFEKLVTEKAGDQADRIDWSRAMQAAAERTGLPVRITGTFGAPDELEILTIRPTERIAGPVPSDEPRPSVEGMSSRNPRGPMSLMDRPDPQRLETARDAFEEEREPGAGIW